MRIKVKIKFTPEQATKAQRRSRGSSTLFLASAGGWATPRPGRFTPRETDPVPIVQETGWAPRPVWTGAENLDPTRTVQPVASRCTD
jgi:hypothetical protein